MSDFHGVRARQIATSISTPVVAGSGITFVVGTAPVHSVDGKANDPVYGGNNSEAVSALGYGDDWGKYTLCEVMYCHFRLYATAPVVFVNVLDPSKHKKVAAAKNYPVKDKKVLLPFEAIKSSVKATGYEAGKDYDLFYGENSLTLEILDGGTIPDTTGDLMVGFDEVDPSQVTKGDIIGGFDVVTKKTSGFELLDSVFPKYGVVPDVIVCPGWSHDPEVAAIMGAKASNINGIFSAISVCDVDTAAVKHYADVPLWKKKQNINAKTQILCFPKGKLGGRVFHMSTQAAGLMGRVDTENGACPAESPSNKLLQINGAVLSDSEEVLLDLQQANYLNANGVVTALNFIGGFVLWGNETACYPANTDAKDYFISVSRMFGWVANSVILTYWSKVDNKMTRRLADSIIDSVNIWLNGLTSEEKLLGGRVEMRPEENSTESLMAGKIVFHIFMTPPSPAKEIEFVQEYDISYIVSAFA